jgi:hypothetical protein
MAEPSPRDLSQSINFRLLSVMTSIARLHFLCSVFFSDNSVGLLSTYSRFQKSIRVLRNGGAHFLLTVVC